MRGREVIKRRSTPSSWECCKFRGKTRIEEFTEPCCKMYADKGQWYRTEWANLGQKKSEPCACCNNKETCGWNLLSYKQKVQATHKQTMICQPILNFVIFPVTKIGG